MINKVLRPYDFEDLHDIHVRACHEFFQPMFEAIDEQAVVSGHTLVVDDTVIAIGGINFLWPGVGEAWLLTSTELENHTRIVYKEIKTFLKNTEKYYKRIQACVKTDFEEGIEFAERFGFEKEGTLRNYGIDGSDHYMMGLING